MSATDRPALPQLSEALREDGILIEHAALLLDVDHDGTRAGTVRVRIDLDATDSSYEVSLFGDEDFSTSLPTADQALHVARALLLQEAAALTARTELAAQQRAERRFLATRARGAEGEGW